MFSEPSNKVSNIIKETNNILSSLFSFLLFTLISCSAFADYDIGGPTTGPFARIVSFVQDIVNLIDGPIALAFSFLTLGGMALTWAIAPKMVAALGVFFRVMLAVIIILNLGVWITAMNS